MGSSTQLVVAMLFTILAVFSCLPVAVCAAPSSPLTKEQTLDLWLLTFGVNDQQDPREPGSLSTGFRIGPAGLITCNHWTRGSTKTYLRKGDAVWLSHGNIQGRWAATVSCVDSVNDLASLECPQLAGLPGPWLACLAATNPQFPAGSVTEVYLAMWGSVTPTFAMYHAEQRLLQPAGEHIAVSSCDLTSGMSGSAICTNLEGQLCLVGVYFAAVKDKDNGEVYAELLIPAKSVARFLADCSYRPGWDVQIHLID